MISAIQKIPAGDALRIWLSPPVKPSRIRLLRKEADTFTGWDDPDAFVVLDGVERVVTDFTGLLDGVEVFYRAYYRVGSDWLATDSHAEAPGTSYLAKIIDPMMIVRDRLELGLRTFVQSGALQHERGFIPVLTASPQIEGTAFPIVTVHTANDAADMRALGEEIGNEVFSEADGFWHSFEGSISRTDLMVVGWSLNADERRALRNTIKAIFLANLPVFDAAGLLMVTYSGSDADDFETYGTPMYQCPFNFSCHALAAVESTDPPIRDTTVTRND